MLEGLNYDLIKRNPKVFLGYSDITALHTAIGKKTGLVTFHGPTLGLMYENAYTHNYYLKALMSTAPIGLVGDPVDDEVLMALMLDSLFEGLVID